MEMCDERPWAIDLAIRRRSGSAHSSNLRLPSDHVIIDSDCNCGQVRETHGDFAIITDNNDLLTVPRTGPVRGHNPSRDRSVHNLAFAVAFVAVPILREPVVASVRQRLRC